MVRASRWVLAVLVAIALPLATFFSCGGQGPSAAVMKAIAPLKVPRAVAGGFRLDESHDGQFRLGALEAKGLAPGQHVVRALGPRFEAAIDGRSGAVRVRDHRRSAGVTLTPRALPLRPGRGVQRDGRVFFSSGDDSVVQTPVENGVMEDIILSALRGDTATAEWTLELDPGLVARQEADGSIDIVEVGAEHAGASAYRLPAPVLRQADGSPPDAEAHWILDGQRVALVATGLSKLTYPIDIDPSLLITTTTDFLTAGNLDADVSATNNAVVRSRVGGGSVAIQSVDGVAYTTARIDHASVAYNGYLYVIGGFNGADLNQLEYGPISANGFVTSHVVVNTPFPASSARSGLGAVAVNSTMYVVGGGTSTTLYDDVLTAHINADGSLGAFSTSPNHFTTARRYHSVVTASGYLYVFGGLDALGNALNDVQMAVMNADGTVGPFTTLSIKAFSFGRYRAPATTYDNTIYVVGGTSKTGTLFNDIWTGEVDPGTGNIVGGATTAFAAVAGLTTVGARTGHAVTASNGFLWVTGGSGSLTGAGQTYEVDGAPILPGGNLGPFHVTSSGMYGSHRQQHQVVGYGNFLLMTGGVQYTYNNTYQGYQNDVWVDTVSTNGAPVSPPALGNPYTNAGFCESSAVWNGWVYSAGGQSLDGFRAPVDMDSLAHGQLNADGTVVSWTLVDTWPYTAGGGGPFGRRCTRVAVYNGVFYVVGGFDHTGTRFSDVWYTRLTAANDFGTWTQVVNALPTARGNGAVVVSNGKMYVLGGRDAVGLLSDILIATLDPVTGAPGPFVKQASPTLSSAREAFAATVYGGNLYVAGGPTSTLEFAPIAANGSVGTFTSLGTLPWTGMISGALAFDGNIYVNANDGSLGFAQLDNTGFTLGTSLAVASINTTGYSNNGVVGFNGRYLTIAGDVANFTNTYSTVRTIPASATGPLGAFAASASGFGARQGHCTVSANGFVYAIGGVAYPGPALASDIQYSPVALDGTLGTPVSTTPVGWIARSAAGCAVYNGTLYVAGGVGASGALTDLSYATLSANGSIGPFTSVAGAFPAARSGLALAAQHGTLYAVGGQTVAGIDGTVFISTLGANGVPSAFTASGAAVSPKRIGHALIANDNALFVIGGFDGTSYLGDVQVSLLAPTGAPTGWAPTTGLPMTRAYFGATLTNGHIYVSGGTNATGAYFQDTYYGSLVSGGTVGSWVNAPNLAAGRMKHALAASRGFLFAVGGETAANTTTAAVEQAAIAGATTRAAYSRFVDLGTAAPTIDSVTLNGTAGLEGLVSLAYRVAPATGVFGAWQSKGVVPLGSAILLGATNQRYLELKLSFDDSAAVTVDQNDGRERDLTDITVAYTLSPPSALQYVTTPQSVVAGVCSGAVTVNTVEAGGVVSPVSALTALNLSSSAATTTFYSDATCTTAVTSVNVAAGASQGTFYFKDTKAGSPQLTVAGAGLGSVAQTETITPGVASKVAFVTNPPASITAATNNLAGLVVNVQDQFGNFVSAYTNVCTLGLGSNPTGASLGQNYTVSSGTLTFTNSLTKAGVGFTLTMTCPGLAVGTSTAFTVVSAAASSMSITTQPTTTAAGSPLNGPPTVTFFDAFGNVSTGTTSPVTVSFSAGNGATLSGTLTVNAVAGVATFSDLSINLVNATFTLKFTSGAFAPVSNAFGITPGAPSALVVGAVVSSIPAGGTMQVRVTVNDAYGNTCTSASNVISFAIGTNPSTGTLSGMVPTAVANGSSNLAAGSIDKVGTGYTLVASSPGLTSATTAAFNVTPGVATTLALLAGPSASTVAGADLGGAGGLQVAVNDAYGNRVTYAVNGITAAIGANPTGALLLGTTSLNTVSGVATFAAPSGVNIRTAGTGYTLKFTSGTLTPVTTPAFDVTPGTASALAFSASPSGTYPAGGILGPSGGVKVSVLDAYSNVVTGSTAPVAVSAGAAPLFGTTPVNAVAGVATFTDLNVRAAGTNYKLTATSAGVSAATSSAFNIVAAAPSALAFTTQPASVTAGATMAGIGVGVTDAYGNPVSNPVGTVSVAIGNNAGGGTLSGTTSVALSVGTAAFTTLSIDKAGAGYTLAATSTGLTGATSNPFSVLPGAATHLAFAVQPTTVAAVTSMTPAVQVAGYDAFGNVATSFATGVALTLATNPGSSTLTGGASVTPTAGVAAFGGLQLNKVQTGYTLKATAGALTATSTAFDVVPGAPVALQIQSAPLSGTAGAALTTLTVAVVDAGGNVVTSATDSVTIAIQSGPAGATLSGTTTVLAVSGIATFAGLSLDKSTSTTTYTLVVTATGRTSALRTGLVVSPAAPTRLAFTTQPAANVPAGAAFTVGVTAYDALGNVATNASTPIALALAANPTGATLLTPTSGSTLSGVMTLSPRLTVVGAGYTLQATSGTLTPDTSTPFNIVPGMVGGLAFVQQPTAVTAGQPIAPPVTVVLTDQYGNPMDAGTASVTMSLNTNPAPGLGALDGGLTVVAVGGLATFPSLSIDKANTGYKLGAAFAVLAYPGATSQAFTVNAGPPVAIAFSQASGSVTAGACSGTPATIGLLDAFGNPTAAVADVTVTVSGTGLTYYSDASCTVGAGSFVIATGQASTPVYFKSATPNPSITVTATSSAPPGTAAFTATVLSGNAQKLGIPTPARTATAGVCSGGASPITLRAEDNLGNPTGIPTGTTVSVSLSGASGVSFFTDANCSTAAVTSVTLGSATPSVSLYFVGTQTQTFTFSATSSTLTSASQAGETIIPAQAAKLRLTTPAPTVTAGACSSLRTVEVVDQFGNPTVSVGGLTLALQSSTGGTFYAGTSCPGTAVTTLPIAAGAGSVTLEYVHTSTQATTVTVSDSVTGGLGSTTESPTIQAAGADHLRFAAQPLGSVAGTAVAGPPAVAIEDVYGNRVLTETRAVTVALATNPGNAALAGTTSVAAVAGLATFGAVNVTLAGNGYVLAASATGLTGASSNPFPVDAAAPAKLVYATPPSNAVAGVAIAPAIRVEVHDAFENVVPGASGSVAVALEANAGGATASGATTAQVTLGLAQLSGVKVTQAGQGYVLRATLGTLSPAVSPPFDVTFAAPDHLIFTVQPSPATAGQPIARPIAVSVRDAFDNLVLTAPQRVQLSLAPPNTPGGVLSGTASQVADGGVATFADLSVDRNGRYALLANSSPPLPASTSNNFDVASGSPTHLIFLPPSAAAELASGTCSPKIVVEARDDGENASPVVAAQTVSLNASSNSGVSFFTDAACLTEITAAAPLSLNAGATSFNFYFKASNGGVAVLNAATSALRAGSQTWTITSTTAPLVIIPADKRVGPGVKVLFSATGGVPPYSYSFKANNSHATLNEITGAYVSGSDVGVVDYVQVSDVAGAHVIATITVDAPEAADAGTPLRDRPPVNGWSCGCESSSGGSSVLALVGLLLLVARRRRPQVALAVGAVLLAGVPARAEGGGSMTVTVKGKKGQKAQKGQLQGGTMTVTPKKKGGTGAPSAPSPAPGPASHPSSPQPAEAQKESAVGPPPVVASPPPPVAPVRKEKPAVAVLDVDVTIPGEKLDTAAFTEIVVSSFDQSQAFKVISSKELATLLGNERQKALSGCTDDGACMAELTSALGAEFLVQASVGKVGQNYLVSGRLFDARRNRVVGRASIQAHDPNALFEATWKVSQQVLDAYGSVLPSAESQAWAARPRAAPPSSVVAAPSFETSFGLALTAAAGYQPRSSAGNRGSLGGELDLTYRANRLDLSAGVIISPMPGARVSIMYALIDSRFRLGVGARGAAFPTAGLYGGGLGLSAELALSPLFAVTGAGAAEAYPGGGDVVVALLGQVGVAAHF